MMDRSRDSRKLFWEWGFAALVLFLVIFLGSPLAPYVRGMFANVLAPRATDPAYASLSRDALIARLKDAEHELSQIKYQSVLYGLLADENAKLRQAQRAAPIPQSILVRVLSAPPRTAYDTLLVDQGSTDGIAKNDLAEYEGIALGRVVSLGAHTSLIQLFSTSGIDSDAFIGKPQSIVVAHGMGGGAFELSVPQGVTVSVGDSVRLPGTQSLLLGMVSRVASKATDPSQTVYVHSPVSFGDVDFLEIVPNQN